MAASQFDVTVNARGQQDYGLYGDSVDGFGVNTYGFVWSCGSIWDVGQDPITTTWIDCPNPNATIETCED